MIPNWSLMIKEFTQTNLESIWYHLEPSESEAQTRDPLVHKQEIGRNPAPPKLPKPAEPLGH